MQIGFVGLGKMGGNMALRLTVGSPDGRVKGVHAVVGYARDPNPDLVDVPGVQVVDSIEEMIRKLTPPRAVWVMVPAGKPTESVVTDLAERLQPDDLIIDGGNSYYKDTMRRAEGFIEARHGFPRRRHLRRNLGTQRRVLHDGRAATENTSRGCARSSTLLAPSTAGSIAAPAARGTSSR
jgi:hypothetical protein